MAGFVQFTEALLADCRRRYEETDEPVAAIAARMGINKTTFYSRLIGWAWRRRSERPPGDRVKPEVVSARRMAAPDKPVVENAEAHGANASFDLAPRDQSSLVARVQRVLELDIAAVERVIEHLRGGTGSIQNIERVSRTLAVLTKTLKELSGLRDPESDDTGDDDIPRDIDELRRVLAQRIDRLEREDDVARRDAKPGAA